MPLSRRAALAGSGALLLGGIAPSAAAPFEWRTAAPADVGLAPDMAARLDKLVADKRAWGLHGVVVTHKGALVLERYFEGEDEIWGTPGGRVAFGPDTLHDLRSVTKSILGLLYGIARAQDKVPPPERRLTEAFPDYADLATDPRAKRSPSRMR
jgi:CubicO group peptidase (beta-lactamase class C family)